MAPVNLSAGPFSSGGVYRPWCIHSEGRCPLGSITVVAIAPDTIAPLDFCDAAQAFTVPDHEDDSADESPAMALLASAAVYESRR